MSLRYYHFCVLVLLCFSIPSIYAQEISRELEGFQEVKTFNGVKVIVVPSQENRIEISGHSKEKVKHHIIEDRLEIRLTLDHIWSDDNTVITVYGRTINTLDANEGSSIEVKDKLEGEIFELRAQEGASIWSEVSSDKVISKAVTGGIIHVRGKANEQEVEVNTAGQFFGNRLYTKRAEIKANTAGKAEIHASDYCKATAGLGGTIEIKGNPSQLDTKTSLGGKIL